MTTTRNVNLTPGLNQFVEDQVRSGVFQNASEVVRAGLRALKAEEEHRAARIAALNAAIQMNCFAASVNPKTFSECP